MYWKFGLELIELLYILKFSIEKCHKCSIIVSNITLSELDMNMNDKTPEITELVVKAAKEARKQAKDDAIPPFTQPIEWPVQCLVGPGLEGAIACESKIGYVNGSRGELIYRGYDVFDLCAYSSYEEVSYLLMHGSLPTANQLKVYKEHLVHCRGISSTLRVFSGFDIERMSSMGALRLGAELMRKEFTDADNDVGKFSQDEIIGTDEDSIAMETKPKGEKRAIYEFRNKKLKIPREFTADFDSVVGYKSCYRLIAGLATLTAAIARIKQDEFPLRPRPDLSHAGNLLYMFTGNVPSPEEERIMDIILILHADHGMNASTFAAMVVASTLSDLYFSVGSGIAALNGPLHGGANEQVVKMLQEIGSVGNVAAWYKNARKNKKKVMGFGHRVYKAYDPRARILRPLAKRFASKNKQARPMMKIAEALEKKVINTLGKEKGIFPNVDFYSGIVYHSLGIPSESFTPIFAVSRVAGWTARVMEYLQNNRIFRPRAVYTGGFGKKYPVSKVPNK
jgi:citrate synthase